MSTREDSTSQLLQQLASGDKAAEELLTPIIYHELRALAARRLRHERVNHTLQPTALVNEVYLKLVGQRQLDWKCRAQVFAIAATFMQRVLADHARKKLAGKRGKGRPPLTLDLALFSAGKPTQVAMVELNEALELLSKLNEAYALVARFKLLAGLTNQEIAEVMGVSDGTVKNYWSKALVWLAEKFDS